MTPDREEQLLEEVARATRDLLQCQAQRHHLGEELKRIRLDRDRTREVLVTTELATEHLRQKLALRERELAEVTELRGKR